jgi:2,3-bisphosphoglycerate-independent phosphoglycerate mutase
LCPRHYRWRDTRPKAGVEAIEQLQNHIDNIGVGRIVTLGGRYYAMDRDHRWDASKKLMM